MQFKSENYIEQVADVGSDKYDVVLCLSTIKWIHLNFGDPGIKALFLKVSAQLTPGGIFIFEP